MSLLMNYYNKSAEKTRDFTNGVVIGISSSSVFASLAAEIIVLKGINTALIESILPRKQRNFYSNKTMLFAKGEVTTQLDVVRKLADKICNGDEDLERLTGFKPSKRGRSKRTFISAAYITSVVSTGVKGQLLFTLKATIPGNTGYEVHYIMEGKDWVAGTAKVMRTTTKLLVSNFPSYKELEVYVITLSTNNVRSTSSNHLPAATV